MKEYDNIPDGEWVLARKQTNFGRKAVIGWVAGRTSLCYVVFQPELGKSVYVGHEYVWSLSIDKEAHKDLIDFVLDQGDEEWFRELTGGIKWEPNR